uniref:Uncharacterized protein n=1 Tax=Compsopogon caeruleus TaxID=31354 RepID=A0A7S1XH07_9RHOD|mmetsp:Transcript_7463/g.15228  ORF Transcript_7463/g.15228 Transcript_7463/m.15228 type:complete len:184 (+) Transcript_7463:28-579(+)
MEGSPSLSWAWVPPGAVPRMEIPPDADPKVGRRTRVWILKDHVTDHEEVTRLLRENRDLRGQLNEVRAKKNQMAAVIRKYRTRLVRVFERGDFLRDPGIHAKIEEGQAPWRQIPLVEGFKSRVTPSATCSESSLGNLPVPLQDSSSNHSHIGRSQSANSSAPVDVHQNADLELLESKTPVARK